MNRMTLGFLFVLLATGSVFPQDNSSPDADEGFGLQASIFRNTRSVHTDLNRNFSDASSYNLTPGDVFTLSLSAGIGLNATSGNRTASYSIQLQEDYTLDIPVLGRLDAKGKRIPDLQRYISENLIKALALQYVSFNLSAPAQYNVFIYGNVQSPGFVTATPMHRLIDAIAIAGGFKSNGSYRAIELKRNGGVVSLDISRFYSRADFDANLYLMPGDKIFVPDADIVASISGLIQFPGTDELVEGESLMTLINLAGGVLPGALTSRIEIQRLDNGIAERIVGSEETAQDLRMVMGDRVLVRSVSENVERITIEGAVYGSRLSGDAPVEVPDRSYRLDFPYYPGISLLDILDSVGGPTPRGILNESFIRRGSTGEIRPIDVASLWIERDELLNIALFPGDYIFIPLQKTEIFVSGSVNRPGAIPYTPGYDVADYLLLAGGLVENLANPKGIYLVDETGSRSPLVTTDTVEPGSLIHVDKKWLFAADQTVQNVLITTAWVTSIVTVVTTILNFVLTYIL